MRIEIRTALKAGNRVIPVLLGDDTLLPVAADLPEDLAALADLQALRVAHSAVDEGLARLEAALDQVLVRPAPTRPADGGGEHTAHPGPAGDVTTGKSGVAVAGAVHGPVIGEAHGPVVTGTVHGPVAGRDVNHKVTNRPVGGAALLAAVLAAWLTNGSRWIGGHRVTSGVAVAVIVAGAGVGTAVATNHGSTGSDVPPTATSPAVAPVAGAPGAAPSAAALGGASPSATPGPAPARGTTIATVQQRDSSPQAWADGHVLAIETVVPGAHTPAGGPTAFEVTSYSLATGEQLATYQPTALQQERGCADQMVRGADGEDILLVEQALTIPAQGVTPASYTIDLTAIDATDGSVLWNAAIPGGSAPEPDDDQCVTAGSTGWSLSYTANGKYALDDEAGTPYLVDLASGAITAEPLATWVLGDWLAQDQNAETGDGASQIGLIDPASGAKVGTIASNTGVADLTHGGVVSLPAAGGGMLAVVTDSEQEGAEGAAYSLPSGSVAWLEKQGSAWDEAVGVDPDTGAMVSYMPLNSGTGVDGIDPRTGAALWTVSDAQYCGMTMGRLYAVANGQLAVLNETTGQQITYNASVSSCPTVLDGIISETSASSAVEPATYTSTFIIG